jgi:hypothetical protein
VKSDTDRIKVLSSVAACIDNDERTVSAIRQRILEYEQQIKGTTTAVSALLPSSYAGMNLPQKGRSKHEAGRDYRTRFVNSCSSSGITLASLTGKMYQTIDGRKVCIASANELDNRPCRWFLGAKDEPYNIVVLLCGRKGCESLEFILPQEFLKKYWNSLSRRAGEVKFNVVEDGANYYLLVPPRRRESITHFNGSRGVLRPQDS